MSLAERLEEQLPKTFRKLVPCDAKKAKALTVDLLFAYSWFALQLATEGFRCEDPEDPHTLKDIVEIWKLDEPEEKTLMAELLIPNPLGRF